MENGKIIKQRKKISNDKKQDSEDNLFFGENGHQGVRMEEQGMQGSRKSKG